MTSNRWSAADLPDLSGRTVVVTGASSGIGIPTTAELARAGARVVLAVRNVVKGEEVARRMAGSTEVRHLELTSLASIREFAAAWTGDLDILVNNAGIMLVPAGRTEDGFESQIGTNHLGHFALTNLLLPRITGRVVTISSPLHARGRIDVDDLNWERRGYDASRAYADSKQANVLFTLELQRRLTAEGSSVRALSAHPGIARTNLGAHISGLRGALSAIALRTLAQDAEHGALPTLYAATQDIPGNAFVGPDGFGHLRGHPELVQPSRASQDADLARRLWARSVELTAADSPVLTHA
ncbi:MAG TPA: oxidoreductase [Candidatus Dormibacteraeota bacterium]|jgi:NAD(P)-dependent dehydrogenase (short-subunit alcohol dehydrogenase family)|nr:oxidoreductase [Candidatus Dormibacteraeota bacterium]